LIIEVDGGYHNSEWGKKYDDQRSKELKNQRRNTKIWRFSNDEVMDIDNEQPIKSLLRYVKEIQEYREKGGKLNRKKDLIKDKDTILSLSSFGLIE
jgi:very-short-patch-repair endonuclease